MKTSIPVKYLLVIFFLYSSGSIVRAGGGSPVAAFSFYVEFVGLTAEVSFNDESIDATSWDWDFGDGAFSAEENPFHAFTEPGIYIVCLTAHNDSGSDTYCDSIVAYLTPGCMFSYTGDPIVNFTDLSSNAPTQWDWFFGDGFNSEEQNPEHTYAANGEYDVCLGASNPGGGCLTCQIITISTYVITDAAFSYTGDPDVTFTDLSTIAPFEWSWDFGDGVTSDLQNPVHSYMDNGVYTVCLTATNAGGSDTECSDITIGNVIYAPEADYTYIVVSNCGPVAYTDISTNSPASWLWTFADGFTSTEQNPTHEFTEEYIEDAEVCLIAGNAAGSDTICKIIDWCADAIQSESDLRVSVFPNPADDHITVQGPFPFSAYTCELFSVNGEKVLTLFSEKPAQTISIDLKQIKSGYYILQIIGDNDHFSKGIVIE
ncbi:MAG: PKD domain-containing protein [Chitinophagales bacterium]|nr:PKD domain-containing protein [Chitinophagales bacterium]